MHNTSFDTLRIPLEQCPALVLNADFRPLSYFPLSVWCWKDSVMAVFLERVNIISRYEKIIRSPSTEMQLPSVISLKSYIKRTSKPVFNRYNVFLRDNFTCQYCGSKQDLTFDHIMPRSRGGENSWINVVTACSPCNVRKGQRSLKKSNMYPKKYPFIPTITTLQKNALHYPKNFLHESWIDFMYWDIELEP